MVDVTIPYKNWKPRDYQMPLWVALEGGIKRICYSWHRRAGKDAVALQWVCRSMVSRPANYWYVFPQYDQARRAVWEAMNPHTGRPILDDIFPLELRKKTRNDMMMIEFFNGSTFKVMGSDNTNSLVGAPPAGVVFSEYALQNPVAWDLIRPILLENGGWAIFNSTVRGYNHFWQLLQMAKNSDDWFYDNKTVDDTSVFTPEQLETERTEICDAWGHNDGMAFFRQEYYNDPNSSASGAWYADQFAIVDQQNRITSCPYDPSRPVVTAWDLGNRDSTAIWFAQLVGKEVQLIDYYEDTGRFISDYYKIVKEKPYVYERHFLPHDGASKTIGADSCLNQLRQLGLQNIHILPREELVPNINRVRALLQRCVFDYNATKRGVDCLRNYTKKYNKSLRTWSQTEHNHNEYSNGADAFRYLAMGLLHNRTNDANMPNVRVNSYSQFANCGDIERV